MASPPKPVKLHPEARIDLQKSVAFYRRRAGERWAVTFKQRVEEGLRAIASNPERFPPASHLPGVRRIRIEQFPFSLYYINRIDFIWVVAVAHGKRQPGYWLERLS